MYSSETQMRVRYAETDQMGYVYYGKYAEYFEVGRVEALRNLGLVYAELEKVHHILLPVASMEIRYVRPIRYDELIRIKTNITELPHKFIKFHVEIYNEKGKLATAGKVKLAFIHSDGTRALAPEFMLERMKEYY